MTLLARRSRSYEANGVLEMDSYAWRHTPCRPVLHLGGGNNFDAELCRHCQAPMALAHRLTRQKIHPRMIAAIGPSGPGKDVFLGMLTTCSRGKMSTCSSWPAARSRSSSSSTRWPPWPTANSRTRRRMSPTAALGPLQVLRKKRKPAELIIPTWRAKRSGGGRSSPHLSGDLLVPREVLGVLVLVDARASKAAKATKIFHYDEAHQLPVRAVVRQEEPAGRPAPWPSSSPRPISANTVSTIRRVSPSATRRLAQQCRERLKRHKFFAIGVAGACGYRNESHGHVHVPCESSLAHCRAVEWLLEELAAL